MHQRITVPLEIKSLKARQIEGHGSVFGNTDLGGDVVVNGAFKESLADHAKKGTLPAMFYMHDMSKVLGRWDAMAEDNHGLAVKGTLAKTQLGDEVRELVNMDAMRGLSIGFFIKDADYSEDGIRKIKNVDLIEVSVVSLAMNPLAAISSAKARLSKSGEYVPTVRYFERLLRDVGLSQSVAKRILAATEAIQRDVDLESEGISEMIELCGGVSSNMEIAAIKAVTRR